MAVADAMISTLTETVLTGIMNEARFALDFQDQFEQMKTRLRIMKAFLADTENLKSQSTTDTNRQALATLREVIFEADNILTDCLIRDEYRNDGSCYGLSLKDPFFLHQTGKKLKDINLRMDQMEKTLASFLTKRESVHSEDTYHVRKFMSQDFNPTEIIGLEEDLKEIKGWIFDASEELQQVAVVGMGGLGKTTFAQKIFHDTEVIGHFDKMVWVSVSRAFTEENVVRSMLERLGKNVSGIASSQLLGELQQVLAGKTCLIVMDDVWRINVEWWTNLCSILPKQGGKRSCVIVTTRNEGVASDMGVEGSRIHKPKTLNGDDSWSLFSKFAFSSSKGHCPDTHLENIGKEITKKCGGLPLAIKTIGALLAAKINSPSEWRKISKSLLATEGKNRSVMDSLQFSYDDLPARLKQCLLCFSIYPEDFEIKAEKLIHWWIGEGLVQGSNSKSATEIGYEYLSELIKRCLVEVVQQRCYDGRVYNCKVHDMVRELIIANVKDEEICDFDPQGIQTPKPGSRWLGFIEEMHKLKHSSKDVSKLRALVVLKSSSDINFKRFGLLKSLRVLDFSNIKLEAISMDGLFGWISSLKRLASLNLSGVQSLEMVPPSIRKLRNLQLLILSGCDNLKRLHPSITTLKKLIVLDIGFCPLEYLPRGLGKFSHLQELTGFKVLNQSIRQCCQLLELKELTQLRVLRISISDETEILDSEMDVLAELKNLKVFAIDAENCKQRKEIMEKLDVLSPPTSLQELYLKNYCRETLPKWVNPVQLRELQYLSIENGDLNNLTPEVEVCESKWNLEGLCLKFLTRLEVDWEDLLVDMPFIRYLDIGHCYKLRGFPCSVKTRGIWRKKQGSENDAEATSSNP